MSSQEYIRPQDQRREQQQQATQSPQAEEENNILDRAWSWFTGLFDRERETPTLNAAQEQAPAAATSEADDLFASVDSDLDMGTDVDSAVQEIAAQTGGPQNVMEAEPEQILKAPASPFQKASDLEKVALQGGSTYKITGEDMSQDDPWTAIAQGHGMRPEYLQAFNQHVEEVNVGVKDAMSGPVSLDVGVEVYIPSAQEILFAQARQKTGDYDAAVELYGQLAQGPNVKMMDAARLRSSGEVGEAYGTQGVDGGWFYTHNKDVAGAKESRSKDVGGQKEYKVFWVADFWKCSLFLHDVVFQAGYKPDLKANKHYQLAGKLQESGGFDEVLYNKAMPGDAFQRFGGTRSNESHNAVLSNFPVVTDLGDGTEQVEYDIIGASSDRADEGAHTSIVKKGTSDVVGGYGDGGKIRFFRPNTKQ
ncbi:MAG: hypothetical protein JXX28_06805 [Deltaproteobacteria bacterium]|nr:hypothetical protein [Deltaproteobacteria bacterium]